MCLGAGTANLPTNQDCVLTSWSDWSCPASIDQRSTLTSYRSLSGPSGPRCPRECACVGSVKKVSQTLRGHSRDPPCSVLSCRFPGGAAFLHGLFLFNCFSSRFPLLFRNPVFAGHRFLSRGHRFLLWAHPFPLRASFNCVIVGRGPAPFNCQGFDVSLRI